MTLPGQSVSQRAAEVGAPRVVVLGAGPAGLTAAYQLAKSGIPPLVLEADPRHVGGLARTVAYGGYHFDIGGHRFFSKSRAVEDLWSELLPDDLLVRPRRSRIYFDGRFLAYPLRPLDVIAGLGPAEALRCVASYAHARLRPTRAPESLEQWIVNQFGARLYEVFFKGYTEKVWGMSGREISAAWAAQRIQGLSLPTAAVNALRCGLAYGNGNGEPIKTLIASYRYPRRGPGMLWSACAARIAALGGQVRLGRRCTALVHEGGSWQVRHVSIAGGDEQVEPADHVVNSATLRDTVGLLAPALPARARLAAGRLRYRDFITVALIVRDRRLFHDGWLYIQDNAVKVARIQNFKAWSPEMVPDPSTCCYGMEYFCFAGDALWSAPDASLIELARRELQQLGLGAPQDLLDACVVRQPKAYPIYDRDWAHNVDLVRGALAAGCPGLHQVGRGGMHRYNNQDHSMMTAMLTVQNILAGRELYDPWRVNEDAEYIEGV